MEIKIVKNKISRDEIKRLAEESYGEMVKAVVDVERKVLAVGGEMHVDGEEILLKDGSRQADLWGINLFPERKGDDFIEYESLINIRPRDGNRSMEIEDKDIRNRIKEVISNLIE